MAESSAMPEQPEAALKPRADRAAADIPPVRREPIEWQNLSHLRPPDLRPVATAEEGFRFDSLGAAQYLGPAQFVVPRTFGMSAILGIMTALALLFGVFQYYGAHPVLYLFFGVQVIVICVAQMLYGKTPRAASVASGGLLLPVFVIGWVSFWDRRMTEGALCVLLTSVPIGAFFGYITGTMAAGIFLMMDAAERFLTGAGRPTT